MPSLSRFFVPGSRTVGERVSIAGADAHKIIHVLRLRTGDAIEVIDSTATAFIASLETSGERVEADLVEAIPANDAVDAPQIDLAQAIPKGQKMDFVVEKATELGVGAIVPFYSERTIVHDLAQAKLERWRRLATTAARQSGRREVPTIAEALSFEALLQRMREYDRVLFAWELAPQVPLRERLGDLLAGATRILVVIGPEGGFSHEEAERARERGAEALWLGSRILRTETAALACLAIISAFA